MSHWKAKHMDYRSDAPKILRDFLAYHETIKGHSYNTVDEYFLDLRTFFRFLLAGIFSILLSWAAMHKMLGLLWLPVSDVWNAMIQIILLIPILYAGLVFYK